MKRNRYSKENTPKKKGFKSYTLEEMENYIKKRDIRIAGKKRDIEKREVVIEKYSMATDIRKVKLELEEERRQYMQELLNKILKSLGRPIPKENKPSKMESLEDNKFINKNLENLTGAIENEKGSIP